MRNGPQITTSGIVFSLDGANKNSYPGSGTAWTDAISQNPATLVNGPAYSNDGGGSLSFDGTNDYADFTTSGLTTTATVEMWVKLGASYSGMMFFGWYAYDVYCAIGHIGYNTGNGDVYGISSSTASSLGLVGSWKHYVFEMRSDVSYTNNKIYINCVSQTLSQQLSSEIAGYRTFNNGVGRIAGWRNDTNYSIPMTLGAFNVYNRALTQAEITQNFNALRGRFGV